MRTALVHFQSSKESAWHPSQPLDELPQWRHSGLQCSFDATQSPKFFLLRLMVYTSRLLVHGQLMPVKRTHNLSQLRPGDLQACRRQSSKDGTLNALFLCKNTHKIGQKKHRTWPICSEVIKQCLCNFLQCLFSRLAKHCLLIVDCWPCLYATLQEDNLTCPPPKLFIHHKPVVCMPKLWKIISVIYLSTMLTCAKFISLLKSLRARNKRHTILG